MSAGTVDVVVTGGGGFIGGHLVKDLLRQGLTVRAVDIKPFSEWYQMRSEADNLQLDLSAIEACRAAVAEGAGSTTLQPTWAAWDSSRTTKPLCMLTVLESTHMLVAARDEEVERFFYSSSACVYAANKQIDTACHCVEGVGRLSGHARRRLRLGEVVHGAHVPALPEDFGLATRVARYHNVYGPEGTYKGGREKAPAAICRKVAHAKLTGERVIPIWGDGEQTRSFMYVDDCVYGTQMVAKGESAEPVNVGSAELVSINELVTIVEDIAGIQLRREYDLSAPQGVRGRNSDNTLIRRLYDWEPSISLRDGLEKTYAWVYDNVRKDLGE